jgi:hypothetical protein
MKAAFTAQPSKGVNHLSLRPCTGVRPGAPSQPSYMVIAVTCLTKRTWTHPCAEGKEEEERQERWRRWRRPVAS